MLQHENIVWVKELLVMEKTKEVVIMIKVQDKKKVFIWTIVKSEKQSLYRTKDKGVYRTGGDIVVEKVMIEKQLI